jgi:hypothetical protein
VPSETPENKPPLAAWFVAAAFIGGFCVGGLGLIFHTWVVFWVGLGIVVLSLIVGRFLNMMEYTEEYPSPEEFEEPREAH